MAGVIGLIFLGISAGVASGLLGIGGGLIIVPVLVHFFSFTQIKAQGTSLALLLLPIGFLGAYHYYQKGLVDKNAVLWLALGFFGGSLLGATLAGILPTYWLKKIFGLTLLYAGIKYLFS